MSNQVVYKDRKSSDSRKWDGLDERFDGSLDLLPMWIADMDFQAPQCVIDALKAYVDFGVFGYYKVPDDYFDAIIRWEKEQHGYEIEREWICFSPGVVSGFNWLLQTYTQPGDAVIIQTPVYYPFGEAVVNNGRKLVESELIRTENSYQIDLHDFEAKIDKEEVKAFILCSPHNPCGRVWRREELVSILSICAKHDVIVIADEIHQDIIMQGYEQIPAATVGDFDKNLVTIAAPSKTFNIAGCQNSFVIIPDEELRKKYQNHVKELRVNGGNPFGYIACTAALTGGQEWLSEVNGIIEGNFHYLKETLEEALPEIWIAELEGTYLAYLDLGAFVSAEEIEDFVLKECHIAPDFGAWFGGKNSGTCIRLNLATSRENVEKAAAQIIEAVKERS